MIHSYHCSNNLDAASLPWRGFVNSEIDPPAGADL